MLTLIVVLAKFVRRLLARWSQRANQVDGVSQRRAG
jgi:hypothetical protein